LPVRCGFILDQNIAIDRLPPSGRYEADTINLGPGQRYDGIWPARRPGKWLVDCHIPHHTENDNVEKQGGGGLMMILDVSEN
jgi:manganese oxidase